MKIAPAILVTCCLLPIVLFSATSNSRAAPLATKPASKPANAVPDVSALTQLRMNYAKRADYNPWWDHEDDERKAILAAFKDGDIKKAYDLS